MIFYFFHIILFLIVVLQDKLIILKRIDIQIQKNRIVCYELYTLANY